MTKDFFAGLRVEWHPLLLFELSSINSVGLNNGTYRNLLPAPKNLGLRLDISQGPVVVIVTISFAIIRHILYRPVSHLQFNLQLVLIANFVLLLFISIIVPTTGNKSNFIYMIMTL